jgi:antitoxin HicB
VRTFEILLTPDDNGTFLVTCPSLPEVTTFGKTEDECIRNAVGAVEEALAGRIARGAEIPPAEMTAIAESDGDLVRMGVLPALPELKVELYQAMRDIGVTRAELARRLNWNRNSVDRLFLLDHASRLEQIEAAARALGLEVRAEIVPQSAA